MKVSPELYWLIPYIEIAASRLNISKIKRIRALKVSRCKTKKDRMYGICHYDENNNVSIHIYIDYLKNISVQKNTWRIAKLGKQVILQTLAHELSHMIHHDHTPVRMILECELLIDFMVQLKSEGYISEEKDEKRQMGQ